MTTRYKISWTDTDWYVAKDLDEALDFIRLELEQVDDTSGSSMIIKPVEMSDEHMKLLPEFTGF